MANIHGRTYRNRTEVFARYKELTDKIREQGFNSDGIETERVLLREWLSANPAPEPQKPFYVYFRTAKGGKGYREFKTRDGQLNFMNRHDNDYAFTAYN